MTTFVNRLMEMTWSFRLDMFVSDRPTDWQAYPLSSCFGIALKLQSRLSGRFGQRTNASVIFVPTAIEYHLLDSRLLGRSATAVPTIFAAATFPPPLISFLHSVIQRAGSSERAASEIVDHLGANMANER